MNNHRVMSESGELRRLSYFSETGGKYQYFGYDAFGNVWQVAGSGVPALRQTGWSWYLLAGGVVNNRLANTGYDAMGNHTQLSVIAGVEASYDGENRLSKIMTGSTETAVYLYDAEGRRVAKTVNGAPTYYFYDAFGQLMAEYGGPAQTAATHYFTTDYLGSTRMILNGTGGCLERLDYAPFGGQISRSGYECYGSASNEKPLYTGQIRDGESTAGTDTGQDYFNARYLWANTARFTSPDPVAGSAFNPQSLNLYAYAWNNPLRHTDPTGMVVSWEDSDARCNEDEAVCRTKLQRRYEDRIKQLQSSKDAKQRAKGDALAATYQKLQGATEVFHVVREGGSGSGELTYRGTPGHLYVEMKGSGSMYGEMPDIQKLAHEFKHGEQFLDGLLGFTNITGKWQGYRDDLVDEANAFITGFMAEPVGLDQSKFLQGLGQAAKWGVQEVVKKLGAPGSPYHGRAAQQIPITTIPPSVYAVPRSK